MKKISLSYSNKHKKDNRINKEFFEVLEKVTSPSDPRSKKLIYDLGLVIFEKNTKKGAREIFNLLPKGKARFFLLDDPNDYENFLKELVIAIRKG